MATVTPTPPGSTGQTRPAPAQQTGTDGNAVTSDYQTFLKMLTAQIQNQDPLNPTPSDEFAVQLATFSGVEQQVRTNELLAALGAQFGAMGMAQFAGWVGMEARTDAPAPFRGQAVTLSPNPAITADRVELIARDALGHEVDRREIPVSGASYRWDGVSSSGAVLPNGLYSFELVSFQGGDPVASTPVETYQRVTEIRGDAGATTLVLEGGASVATTDVTALREQGAG